MFRTSCLDPLKTSIFVKRIPGFWWLGLPKTGDKNIVFLTFPSPKSCFFFAKSDIFFSQTKPLKTQYLKKSRGKWILLVVCNVPQNDDTVNFHIHEGEVGYHSKDSDKKHHHQLYKPAPKAFDNRSINGYHSSFAGY